MIDASVWGPHYWWFLHTAAHNYPTHPTSIQKKIHYRLICHFHEFIPSRSMGVKFLKLVERYPVAPYLDDRAHFVQWVHFIHNKINERLEKPTMTLAEHYADFKLKSIPERSKMQQYFKDKQQIVLALFIIILALLIYVYK